MDIPRGQHINDGPLVGSQSPATVRVRELAHKASTVLVYPPNELVIRRHNAVITDVHLTVDRTSECLIKNQMHKKCV